jgi:hypothetical protein
VAGCEPDIGAVEGSLRTPRIVVPPNKRQRKSLNLDSQFYNNAVAYLLTHAAMAALTIA